MVTLSHPENKTDYHSRRQFLRHIWYASIVLAMTGSGCAPLVALLSGSNTGEFQRVFPIDPAVLPEIGGPPVYNAAGKFWISRTSKGLLALRPVCTHLACLYKWVATNNRFECPCHGAKFALDGTLISGPAPRNLDLYLITVTTKDGSTVQTDVQGDPVSVDHADKIEVEVGKSIQGKAAVQQP